MDIFCMTASILADPQSLATRIVLSYCTPKRNPSRLFEKSLHMRTTYHRSSARSHRKRDRKNKSDQVLKGSASDGGSTQCPLVAGQ